MNFKRRICASPGLGAALKAFAKRVCLVAVICIAIPVSVHADLVNGSFEDPNTGAFPSITFINQSFVTGWETDASSGDIEIWSNGINGVASYDGNQHVELNPIHVGTLFQDITGVGAGQMVDFEFAHRARVGTDVLSLTITDLGADNTVGGGNDTILFTKNYSATTGAWTLHTSAGEPTITTVGNNIRFAYDAVSTGSGDLTRGNFIDDAKFSVSIPEPSSIAVLIGLAGLGMFTRRRRRLDNN